MWECDYAREPINYRLFFLKLLKKIWILPLAAVIGAVVIGGIYYFINMIVGGGYHYRAKTVYYVKYAVDVDGKESDYYNYFTWNELVRTDYFVDGMTEAMGGALTKDYIRENITATVESDYRYLYTKSVSTDKNQAIDMEHKMSSLMLDFAAGKDEIESIEVIDVADESDIEDISLIFIDHAVILGAIIGLLAGVLFFVFMECVDTSVYLPSTLEKRYHIPTAGAPSMTEFAGNCKRYIGDKKAAVIAVDEADITDTAKVKAYFPADCDVEIYSNPIAGAAKNTDKMSEIRNAQSVILMVKSGAHNGTKIERIIEQFAREEVKITAFVLVEEDKWLISKYYKEK